MESWCVGFDGDEDVGRAHEAVVVEVRRHVGRAEALDDVEDV